APGPHFYSRSFPLAGFWDCCLWNGRGAIATGILKPIWDAFFEGKYAGKHFCERKFPNQGTYMGLVIAYRPGQCGTQRQSERVATSGPSKRGGGGHPPATLCVRAFSRESLDPPPGTGRETTPQVWTCDGPSLNHLPRGHPPRFSPQVMVR